MIHNFTFEQCKCLQLLAISHEKHSYQIKANMHIHKLCLAAYSSVNINIYNEVSDKQTDLIFSCNIVQRSSRLI